MTTLSREQVQWQRAGAQTVRLTGGVCVSVRATLAQPDELGRGIVRLHPDTARQIGADEGDVVAIQRPAEPAPLKTTAPRSGFGHPSDTGVALAVHEVEAGASQPRVSLSASRLQDVRSLELPETPTASEADRVRVTTSYGSSVRRPGSIA